MLKPEVNVFHDLHDAELLSIDLENQIKLIFKTTDLIKKIVTLISAKHFICNGLQKGNIVLEFSACKGRGLTQRDIGILFELKKSSNKNILKYIEKINSELKVGNLMLVSISPSYGCEIVAICENLQIESI